MIIMNTEPKYFLNDEANNIAEQLQKADSEWQYKVVSFPDSNYSTIKVIDEYGQIVGYWN
jgi:hypothetical protein